MLFKQQVLLRQKLFVLGSLAIGSLLYLVARVGTLDRSVILLHMSDSQNAKSTF